MASDLNIDFPILCKGIVAFADLRLGNEVEPALEAYAKMDKVKGIRFSLAWSPSSTPMGNSRASEGLALTEKFREGFALLSKFGFSYESWMYHL